MSYDTLHKYEEKKILDQKKKKPIQCDTHKQ
jgi:hypothetical protein